DALSGAAVARRPAARLPPPPPARPATRDHLCRARDSPAAGRRGPGARGARRARRGRAARPRRGGALARARARRRSPPAPGAALRAAPGAGREAVRVVPNGVDLAAFAYVEDGRPAARLVFAGNLGYFPNVDAATFLVRDVLPRVRAAVAGAELRLVGARPARRVRALA